MTSTGFRPSIHGWPFGNGFSYEVEFELLHEGFSRPMGFSGGMCRLALQLFHAGTPVQRTLARPAPGQLLYDQLLAAQVDSLPFATILKMYEWQCLPRLGTVGLAGWGLVESLGQRTQAEWQSVRSRIDAGHPVMLTLVEHANDGNPADLTDNHRVVAYAYEERRLHPGEWVHGRPNEDIRLVTLSVYDPNEENDDAVQLTFYTHCDDGWIHLRHNRSAAAYGFFVDDEPRAFASAAATRIELLHCRPLGIVSQGFAQYELRFGWHCRFVPWYDVLVDGVPWQHNGALQHSLQPTWWGQKQCSGPIGTLTLGIRLPRAESRVTVRLLNEHAQSVQVDARPRIACLPYVRLRAAGGEPEICDSALQPEDLFVAEARPGEGQLRAADTSPWRWVFIRQQAPVDQRPPGGDRSRATVTILSRYRLGSIRSPVFANFVPANMAPPVTLTATLTRSRGGVSCGPPVTLTGLELRGQKLFDGFTDPPADYDADAAVTVEFMAQDACGASARGSVTFHARSILFEQSTATLSPFDPAKYARAEAVARQLVELELAEAVPRLAGGTPVRGPADSGSLMRRLRSQRDLACMIDQKVGAVARNPGVWQSVWCAQSDLLRRASESDFAFTTASRPGDMLKASRAVAERDVGACDALAFEIIAKRAVDELRSDPTVLGRLKGI